MIALGHRKLAALSFPLAEDDWTGFVGPERMAASTIRVSRERLSGYAEAAAANGIDWAQVPAFEVVVNTIEEGRRGAGILLDQADRPTVILTTADQLAIGAVRRRGNADCRFRATFRSQVSTIFRQRRCSIRR